MTINVFFTSQCISFHSPNVSALPVDVEVNITAKAVMKA